MKYNQKIWLVLPMRCFLFLSAFVFCSILIQSNLTELTHWWSILASVINIVTIIALWMICRYNHTTYCKMIHYEKKQGSIPQGFLFIVIMLLIGIGGMYLAGGLCYHKIPYFAPMMIAPIPRPLAILNIFLLPLTTTIAEDGLYLGYGVNNIPLKRAAILIPAFFYALQHSFIPTTLDMRFMIYRFLSFFPLTIWICYHYHNKTSISYIMAGHWILNLATTTQIALTSFYPEAYAKLSCACVSSRSIFCLIDRTFL